MRNQLRTLAIPLLARGRDRLETKRSSLKSTVTLIPYSLGDAIDWKLDGGELTEPQIQIPYSLGDAIDWKPTIFLAALETTTSLASPLLARGRDRLETSTFITSFTSFLSPLLARGRDRLET